MKANHPQLVRTLSCCEITSTFKINNLEKSWTLGVTWEQKAKRDEKLICKHITFLNYHLPTYLKGCTAPSPITTGKTTTQKKKKINWALETPQQVVNQNNLKKYWTNMAGGVKEWFVYTRLMGAWSTAACAQEQSWHPRGARCQWCSSELELK